MKRLVIFDLDGTLAKSKAPLEPETGALLERLMELTKVAVISGGAWPQFQKQLLPNLPHGASLANLSLLAHERHALHALRRGRLDPALR